MAVDSNMTNRSTPEPIKMHFAATSPTTSDDSSLGFRAGWLWIDTSDNNLYACRNAAVGAADWVNVSTAT